MLQNLLYSMTPLLWLTFSLYLVFSSVTTLDKRLIQAAKRGEDHPQLPSNVALYFTIMQYALLILIFIIDWRIGIASIVIKFILSVLPVLEIVGNFVAGLFMWLSRN